MFLVDDPATTPDGLPDAYGVDDVPVMVQDTQVGRDGSLRSGSGFQGVGGPLGDTLLVTGTVGRYLGVTAEAVRRRPLAEPPDLSLDDVEVTRRFDLGGGDEINGAGMDVARSTRPPRCSPARGGTTSDRAGPVVDR